MKQDNYKFKMLVFAAILLTIGTSFFYYSNQTLKKQITQLRQETNVLEENFNALKKNYDSLIKEDKALKELNAKLKQESVSLSSAMKSTQLEVEQTLEKLNDFEITVKNSIKWFRENSNIENVSDYEAFRTQLNKCVKFKNNCEIDLKCIYDVNKDNGIRYRYDEDTTDRADFLKDLKLIHNQKGGDCEDFSLLFVAEYNYLLNQCLSNYTRWQITSTVINAKKDYSYKIDENYMYTVCGTFDPREVIGNVAGHCLNAMTKGPIKNSKDIYEQISKSVLVEPQIGELYGFMNSTDQIKIFDDGQVSHTLYYIDFVITDNDLYIYDPYEEKVEWRGYHDFLEDSQKIKQSVAK